MSDILEEVLRDHSDEKKLYYFRKILPFVIGFTILVVIGMVINNWYQDKRLKENRDLGDLFIKTLNHSDEKIVDEVLQSLYKNNPNNKISEIAGLKRVGIKISEGDSATAKILLEEIINNKTFESTTLAFARIVWLSLVIDEPNLVEVQKDRLQEYLKYFVDENQEFFATASLFKAIWYTKNDQNDLAREVLKNLRSIENIPAIIKEQAKALLSKLD